MVLRLHELLRLQPHPPPSPLTGVRNVRPRNGRRGAKPAVAYEVGGDGEAGGVVGFAALDGDAARRELQEGEEAVDGGENARVVGGGTQIDRRASCRERVCLYV